MTWCAGGRGSSPGTETAGGCGHGDQGAPGGGDRWGSFRLVLQLAADHLSHRTASYPIVFLPILFRSWTSPTRPAGGPDSDIDVLLVHQPFPGDADPRRRASTVGAQVAGYALSSCPCSSPLGRSASGGAKSTNSTI